MPTDVRCAILAIAAAGMLLGGCGDGRITDRRQFSQELLATQRDAVPLLEATDRQTEPTEAQKTQLRALKLRFERLLAFDNTSVPVNFLAGKVNLTLRNTDSAERQLRTCIANGPKITADQNEFLTMVEAHHLLGEAFAAKNRFQDAYEQANYTVLAVPTSPGYLVSRASALIQLKKLPEARKDLKAALKLDPQSSRAKALLKFVGR